MILGNFVSDIGYFYYTLHIHVYYTTRRLNPLKNMQSLMAVAAKLVRVFYAMLTKGVDYDSKKMLSDIKGPEVYLQEA